MKSSFELAMERLGGESKKLSDEQKRKISDIDSKYKAKIAEIKLRSQGELRKTASPEEDDKICKEVSDRIQELEKKCEKEKEKAREE